MAAGARDSRAEDRGALLKVHGFDLLAQIEALFRHARAHLSPFKRIRRIEFAELPKTISGKIRRVELRQGEAARRAGGERGATEFWEEDFPDL